MFDIKLVSFSVSYYQDAIDFSLGVIIDPQTLIVGNSDSSPDDKSPGRINLLAFYHVFTPWTWVLVVWTALCVGLVHCVVFEEGKGKMHCWRQVYENVQYVCWLFFSILYTESFVFCCTTGK